MPQSCGGCGFPSSSAARQTPFTPTIASPNASPKTTSPTPPRVLSSNGIDSPIRHNPPSRRQITPAHTVTGALTAPFASAYVTRISTRLLPKRHTCPRTALLLEAITRHPFHHARLAKAGPLGERQDRVSQSAVQGKHAAQQQGDKSQQLCSTVSSRIPCG